MFTSSLQLLRVRHRRAPQSAVRLESPAHALVATASEAVTVEDADRSYFLKVDLEIQAREAKKFIENGVALLETFARAGLRLEASAWRTSADPIRVMNYWSLGSDADVLLEAELALPDVPSFNAFNRMIRHEVKAIAIPIARSERTPLPADIDRTSLRYLHLSTVVDSTSLAEFGARIESEMQHLTRKWGWYLGDTYYATTGRAGAISQLWIIPQDLKSSDVSERLRAASWLDDDLVGGHRGQEREFSPPTTFEILRATPADPLLGDRLDVKLPNT